MSAVDELSSGVSIAQCLAYLVSGPSVPDLISSIVNVAEVNQWRWLEESGQ